MAKSDLKAHSDKAVYNNAYPFFHAMDEFMT
jgi:hypothetical protein